MDRLYKGDTVIISENLKEIYQARGWNYNDYHNDLIGKECKISNIEDKYCYDYCYVSFEDIEYNGTLPVQALIKI